MALWYASELRKALGVSVPDDICVKGVSIDTRTLEEGDLFVALTGQDDGHAFVAEAHNRGAAAALVRTHQEAPIPQIEVEATLDALEALGTYRRKQMAGRVVAVTGSAGKTSTKEMLAFVLGAHASVASYNNHFGVPLTLARMPQKTKRAVFEIGTNAPGEIGPLAKMVRPHVAVVTNVGQAHLEKMGNIEGVRREKLSISQGLDAEGILVVPYGLKVADITQHKTLTFGLEDGADVYTKHMRRSADGWHVEAHVAGEDVTFELHQHGEHQVRNAMATLAVVKALGDDVREAAQKLSHTRAIVGRGKAYEWNGIKLVDESYNANPLSMRAALQTTQKYEATRHIAILGDMLELGDIAPDAHADLAEYCHRFDVVITVGTQSEHLQNALPKDKRGGHVNRQEDVTPALFGGLKEGDVVLVKGSNSLGLGKLVERLKEMKKETPHAV